MTALPTPTPTSTTSTPTNRPSHQPMAPITALTVLYDAGCPTCQRARAWIAGQVHLLPIEFVAAGSPEAHARFPGLDHRRTLADVTVVADNGAVFHKERAWLVILWALARWRGLAMHMATPLRRPFMRLVASSVDSYRLANRRHALARRSDTDWIYRAPDGEPCERCQHPFG